MLSHRVLENACMVSKKACDIMTPMVTEFYNAMNSETSTLKSDKSVFTIADGIVQHLLVSSLFGDKFHAVVGEEEDSNVNITTRPYTVDKLVVPSNFYDLIDTVRDNMVSLSSSLDGHDYKSYSVFIDPIDGTREFATNLGEQCSICIGFSNSIENHVQFGKPVAGIVYRPITKPVTWAAGAASEGVVMGHLNTGAPATVFTSPPKGGFLTSNGGISTFIEVLMDKLNYTRVPSGGAGNKMLMLLEGKGDCYIQDRGISRWDTCGAQAVIEANGGILCKLSTFIETPLALESYTYKKSTENTDFIPGLAKYTPYNVKDEKAVKKGAAATDITLVKPYSNLCGIIALSKSAVQHHLADYSKAIQDTITTTQPSYD